MVKEGGWGEKFSFLCETKSDFCVKERTPVDPTRILKYCEISWLFTPYFFDLYFDIITPTQPKFPSVSFFNSCD